MAREPAPARAGSGEPGLAGLVRQLLDDIPSALSDRVHLAALELRRARRALVAILLFAAAGSVLAGTAWLALWGLLIFAGIAQGAPPIGMLALVAVVNGLGAWALLSRIRGRIGELALPATIRQLTVKKPPAGPAQAEEPE